MPTKAKAKKSDSADQKPLRARKTAFPPLAPAPSARKAPAAESKPPAPEPPAERVKALDLLEPAPKKSRKATATGEVKSFSALPEITAQPTTVPVVPPAGESPPPVSDAASSDAPEPEALEMPEAKIIHIKPPIVIRDLAVMLGVKSFQLIHDLMEMNVFASINQTIEPEMAAKVCEKHGFVFEKEKRERGAGVRKPEPVVEPSPVPEPPVEEELRLRAPIVTMMGHVDHGKTSLLDRIRKARVAEGEAGGITQHIGAYRIQHGSNPITFLDTPGHAAFTAMRARGANVTDIVVLVVAADDGIMPQTAEAINHAKAAGAAIIVAINKIDLPGANLDRVKTQLQERGLAPEDWGGDTIVCPVSATKGTGVEDLISMILLQAEVMELKASPQADPRAIVIEAEVEPGRGPTATVIVKSGTLKPGQAFLCGNYYGKIKQLTDDTAKSVKAAGPSVPVKILGFSGLPKAGDELVVMDSERTAKTLSEERIESIRMNKLSAPARATLESFFSSSPAGQKKALRLVVKADVQGTLEAIVASLQEIPDTKVTLEILHAAVGPISESDVLLATASDAVIIGFGIKVESSAAPVAKREGVQIKLFSIIYELVDQVKEAMAGLLDPENRESTIGHAEVKQVFDLKKGSVAGCIVTDGRIARVARARVLRKKQSMYDGGIATLRRFQDDVKEVRAGLECGIKLGDFDEYEPGDIIECYLLEKVAQKL